MSDNVQADPGSGGATFATDDIGGLHYPINKITFGGLDSQTLASAGAGNVDAGTQRVVLATDQAVVSVDDNGGSLTVDNGGTFAVQIDGINGTVDSNNNSSTPLSGDATFTGTSTDILQFVGITVSVFTDVASATDGLKVQFSSDGTNWDHMDLFTIPAGLGKTFSFQPVARFFRVLYVNGSSAQSVFRLSVILKTATGKPSSHRIADSIVGQDDAEVVKAVITAENPANQFVNVQATTAGNFKVSIEESNGDITGPGTEATALRVTVATDSTGVLSVDDNGGSLTVDNGGTFAVQAAQSGAYNITNISGTISLPTGAATAAKQLADGHNVTIDNASDASAVNIQDGGNSITVDNGGTFLIQEDGAALTALQLIDDTVAVLGTATYSEAATKGNVIGAVRNDVPAALVDTDNEIAPLQVGAEGALWACDLPNLVDSGNSSTSTLGGGATFTGTSVDILQFTAVTVQIFADQDSAAEGMRFEFSPDGTNWDVSHRHDYVNGVSRAFQFSTHSKFFRAVFINGGTPQGAFRLQTILHRQNVNRTIHRLDDALAPDRSANVIKASLMAQQAGTGNFIPIDSTAGGNLKVAVEEFDTALPAGSNLIGDVGLGVRTSGGTTLYKNIDVDAKDEVKATAGQVYWIHAINTTATPVFLKFYNLAAASVTVGTTVPDLTFAVPANADSDGAGFTLAIPNGIAFGTGITIAGTLLVADNNNDALGANALIVNLGFA